MNVVCVGRDGVIHDPIDCMTCLVHPLHNTCISVVEQSPTRVLGMLHVVSEWKDFGIARTLCGLVVPWTWAQPL